MLLDQLVAAVDTLCEIDPAELANAETVMKLQRHMDRLRAIAARAASAWDATPGEAIGVDDPPTPIMGEPPKP